MNKDEIQIIYSLKIKLLLELKGFKPDLETENPKNSYYKCWVYKNSPELQEVLSAIFDGRA